MNIEDLKLKQSVWLQGDSLDLLPVIVVSLDPLKVRYPNGHIEEVPIEDILLREK